MQTKHIPHKIRTQKVDVTFESPENAFACKSQLGEVCKSKLQPALEKLFDEKAGQKTTIRIDNLFVDAGTLQKENWQSQLVETVISELSKYLDTIKIERKPGNETYYEKQNKPTFDDSETFVSGREVSFREAGNETDVLLHFLQHGVLPWYAVIQSKAELLQKLSEQITKPDFQQKVHALITKNDKAFERLLYHLEYDGVFSLLENLDVKKKKLELVKESWYRIFKELSFSETRQKLLFFQAVYLVLMNAKATDAVEDKIVTEIVKQLKNTEQEKLMNLAENIENQSFTAKEERIILLVIKHINKQKKAAEKADKMEKTVEKPQPEKHSVPIIFEDENPVFISNAGLVLLHPFFTNLFDNVGYTENNQWVSEAVQQRALVLSQFLTSGTNEYAEYDLLLNKILTGYPIDDPLPDELKLSDFEKAEADDLLNAVINHWRALKNTSIPSLQNTFLQREGRMVKKESGWLLQVEQKAFDILLDKIPWGFSTIKTPWMEEILSVEWA